MDLWRTAVKEIRRDGNRGEGNTAGQGSVVSLFLSVPYVVPRPLRLFAVFFDSACTAAKVRRNAKRRASAFALGVVHVGLQASPTFVTGHDRMYSCGGRYTIPILA
eukprot:GHVU01121896.1.p2 GENE.GHVU01121896.1~~GHVU01121896.1.p2  ORF type:complete len:106 (+),score=2.06 GHVU01121896.1:361-678(+)